MGHLVIGTFIDGTFINGTVTGTDDMIINGMFCDGTFIDGTFCMRNHSFIYLCRVHLIKMIQVIQQCARCNNKV